MMYISFLCLLKRKRPSCQPLISRFSERSCKKSYATSSHPHVVLYPGNNCVNQYDIFSIVLCRCNFNEEKISFFACCRNFQVMGKEKRSD